MQSLPQDPYENIWRAFVETGQIVSGALRKEIADSWKRCRLEYRLDPYATPRPIKLSQEEVAQRRQTNAALLEAAIPIIGILKNSVQGSGFIITLADKDGYVLEVSGDEEILSMAKANNYLPGCRRTEDEVGTNAIGLCLYLRRPVQVTGFEHYNVNHHPWTCSSSPILSSEKELIGAITLSGKSVGIHKHTLGMVVSAAKAIEKQMREEQLAKEKARLSSYLDALLDCVSEGIVAIGERGQVTHINQMAEKMLRVTNKEVVGKSLKDVIKLDETLWSRILTQGHLKDCEINVNSGGRTLSFLLSVRPVAVHGRTVGKILTFTETRRVHELIHRFGGNRARFTFEDIKGRDPALVKQVELAKIASRTNSRVLLVGESGTGKELFAQAIHNESPRRKGPFVAVSCAAVPRELIEAELFGYREGAFTGARKGGQIGKFELADGGTLFLDEISSMPLEMQAKLLRALQEGEITRLGDERPKAVDVRVIAATNTDLLEEVRHRNFREDLYFRLNVVEIFIPPLRERREDIPLLVEHVLVRTASQLGKRHIGVSEEAMRVLVDYDWPGNVRELENCLERASILSGGETIRIEHLPRQLLLSKGKDSGIRGETRGLREWEKEIIVKTLERCGGNVSQCAKHLGLSRSTLHRKIRRLRDERGGLNWGQRGYPSTRGPDKGAEIT